MEFKFSMNETINQTIAQAPQILGVATPLTTSPTIDIFLLTIITALFTTIVRKHMTDQSAIRALRKEMKGLQKKMREQMKKDPKKAQVMQQEIMKKNMENMKHEMNPKIMLTTMAPLLVVFFFVKELYGPFGEFFNLGFTTFGWLGTYIVFSIINSIIIKKLLDVA